jgi:hypothetical protein
MTDERLERTLETLADGVAALDRNVRRLRRAVNHLEAAGAVEADRVAQAKDGAARRHCVWCDEPMQWGSIEDQGTRSDPTGGLCGSCLETLAQELEPCTS